MSELYPIEKKAMDQTEYELNTLLFDRPPRFTTIFTLFSVFTLFPLINPDLILFPVLDNYRLYRILLFLTIIISAVLFLGNLTLYQANKSFLKFFKFSIPTFIGFVIYRTVRRVIYLSSYVENNFTIYFTLLILPLFLVIMFGMYYWTLFYDKNTINFLNNYIGEKEHIFEKVVEIENYLEGKSDNKVNPKILSHYVSKRPIMFSALSFLVISTSIFIFSQILVGNPPGIDLYSVFLDNSLPARTYVFYIIINFGRIIIIFALLIQFLFVAQIFRLKLNFLNANKISLLSFATIYFVLSIFSNIYRYTILRGQIPKITLFLNTLLVLSPFISIYYYVHRRISSKAFFKYYRSKDQVIYYHLNLLQEKIRTKKL